MREKVGLRLAKSGGRTRIRRRGDGSHARLPHSERVCPFGHYEVLLFPDFGLHSERISIFSFQNEFNRLRGMIFKGKSMFNENNKTELASPQRTSAEMLAQQSSLLSSQPFLLQMMDCFPEPVVVMNQERQIVQANNKMATLLGKPRNQLVGLRMGEAVSCMYGSKSESGCGTSRFCQVCGAVRAILNCQETMSPDVQDCNILCQGAKGVYSLDLKVWANPLKVGDEQFTVFAVRDISAENRRKVMERIFFHDALNAASGLRGIFSVMPGLSLAEFYEIGEMAQDCSEQLVDILESQRDLAAAERGELKIEVKLIEVGPFLNHLAALYHRHPAGKDKNVIIQASVAKPFWTDPVLLGRVLGNLIKNALEASQAGQTVHVNYSHDEQPVFTVHNDSVMLEEIQLQLFKRSISTKGTQHRGVGTYSIKLLTENYLKGNVSFHSLPGAGTTFEVRLPNRLPEE